MSTLSAGCVTVIIAEVSKELAVLGADLLLGAVAAWSSCELICRSLMPVKGSTKGIVPSQAKLV